MEFLVIENDRTCREAIGFLIEDEDHSAESVPWSEDVWDKIKDGSFDVILLDLDSVPTDELDRMIALQQEYPDLLLVLVVVEDRLKLAADAVGRGVTDILEKPFQREHLVMVIARLVRIRAMQNQIEGLKRRVEKIQVGAA